MKIRGSLGERPFTATRARAQTRSEFLKIRGSLGEHYEHGRWRTVARGRVSLATGKGGKPKEKLRKPKEQPRNT